ncbi:carbohydrate porin [Gluconacetobacter asukensis]|uniref:Carbohydrate porin n=1 Tax=Gluconacetobacter asukensis TaxID=1017181 RepID=A0A7W4J2P9_9PROT|nr:carbohydrate porin [Gluconacetobacter asukensis]MBB2173598.1 carbohydrate porin [Gluconacetobacter asukensis]
MVSRADTVGHILHARRATRFFPAFVLLVAAMIMPAVRSWAQSTNTGPGALPEILNAIPPESNYPPPPPVTHLLQGEAARWHDSLANKGVNLLIDDWSEFAGNLSGGTRKAQDFAGQVAVEVDLDWDRILHIPDFTTTITAVQRHGRRLSTDALQDGIVNPEQIYGGGGNVVIHLVYFYAQKKWMHGRVILTMGRYAPGPDFDSSPLQCLVMGQATCSQPRATTLTDGYSSWPGTAWSAMLRVRPTVPTYITFGAYETSPIKGGTAGTDWGGDHMTGVTLAFGGGYEPVFGPHRLNGHYKAGMLWDSSPHAYNVPAADGVTRWRHGQMISYIAFDQMVLRNGHYSDSGVIVQGGYTHVTSAISVVSDQAYVGLLDVGQFPGRPRDALGLTWSTLRYGPNVKSIWQPTATSFTPDPLVPDLPLLASHEAIFDATYNFHLRDGVDIAPDFQYFWRPGGSGRVPNAAILGVNFHAIL